MTPVWLAVVVQVPRWPPPFPGHSSRDRPTHHHLTSPHHSGVRPRRCLRKRHAMIVDWVVGEKFNLYVLYFSFFFWPLLTGVIAETATRDISGQQFPVPLPPVQYILTDSRHLHHPRHTSLEPVNKTDRYLSYQCRALGPCTLQ